MIGEYVNITSVDQEAEQPHPGRQKIKNSKAPEMVCYPSSRQ